MADVKPAPDEATLRECHADLLERVQDQRREVGVPVPDTRTAEKFLEPIMEQLARPEKLKPRPAPPEKPPAEEARQWYAEPEHSPKLADIPGTKASFYSAPFGDVKFNPATGAVDPAAAAMDPRRQQRRRLGPAARAALRRIRELMTLPEWRAKLESIAFANVTREEREKMYRKILAESVRLFGSPMKEAARRIQVG